MTEAKSESGTRRGLESGAAWNYVIGGLIVAGLLFFVLAAVFHWA